MANANNKITIKQYPSVVSQHQSSQSGQGNNCDDEDEVNTEKIIHLCTYIPSFFITI